MARINPTLLLKIAISVKLENEISKCSLPTTLILFSP